jgi:hypothetical protein
MVLDQFYTKKHIASIYYSKLQELIDINDYDYIIEPSAGNGSFYSLLSEQQRIGIDLQPKYEGIIEMDFFDYKPPNGKICFIGNPPFGKNSSLAIQFFNQCAQYGSIIAFIIPKTFKRVSVQNQLDLNFHLIHSEDLPLKPCCFNPKMDAKCCFQVWERKSEKREKVVLPKVHTDFYFLKLGPIDVNGQPTPPDGADFAMKAYGSNCGKIIQEGLEDLRPKSWHWIVANIDKQLLKSRFEELDYSLSKDTVRQDSIGQQEVIQLYIDKYG